jgi:competence protein ComEC
MAATVPVLFCLAYISGLLLTGIPCGGWVILGLGIGARFTIRRLWKTAPPSKIWLIAGIIGLFASVYFQIRIPQPGPHDISRFLSDTHTASVDVLVEGRVISLPHETRSQKVQFWLIAQRVVPIGDNHPVNGKLYVTAPLEQTTNLHPGQIVSVGGTLYLPKPATNPGGFDFKSYLQQESSFVGLRGKEVNLLKESDGWGLWQVQQRIVRSQLQALGKQEGSLLSSMVLGSKAVDLPYDIKDQFVRVGLAHALAASGFQTSLILGVILALTRRCSARLQFLLGTACLIGFVGLAGLQPAILRAAVMGFASLLALVMQRKVKPFGLLLFAATFLLLWNPLWVWDLGFQLSFLATLGLIVTVPPLSKHLDWLPTAIAPMLAVPIAATLWTLPLQLQNFSVLCTYSIPANVMTAPLISVISLGGMASAVAALIWSPAGSTLAWPLKFPTQALIAIVNGFDHLPGNSYVIGTISVLAVIVLYGFLGLATFHPWWQRRWWLALATGIVLVMVPVLAKGNLTQITVLDTGRNPTMVIRERGKITVVSSANSKTLQLTLLPYLANLGANRIDLAISPKVQSGHGDGWNELAQSFAVKNLYTSSAIAPQPSLHPSNPTTPIASHPLPLNQTIRFGAVQFTLLSGEPAIAQLSIHNQTWLWLGSVAFDKQENLAKMALLSKAEILWWAGKALHPAVVEAIQPKVAIASTQVDRGTSDYFNRTHIQFFATEENGAIQWTPDGSPNGSFKAIRESDDNLSTAL